jgi:hypothetical protein
MCHSIIFTEVHYNALSGSKVKSEFVEIYNYGTVPHLMTGAVLARYSGLDFFCCLFIFILHCQLNLIFVADLSHGTGGVPMHNYTFGTVTIQPKSYYVISFFKEVSISHYFLISI